MLEVLFPDRFVDITDTIMEDDLEGHHLVLNQMQDI